LRDMLKHDTENPSSFINGAVFNPLNVGQEYVPQGGHGRGINANFTDGNGKDYDIKYIQVGWSITHTYDAFAAHALNFTWMMGMAFAQKKSYFQPNNLFPDERGLQMGIDAAKKFVDFPAFVKSHCGCGK